MAKGARWTFLPYSMYWRLGSEAEVEAAILRVGDLRGATCWDLGTHFGIFTIGLAFAVGPQGQVAGFEPDPASFARCERHVLMNRLCQVKLFNAAVCAEAGAADLLLYEGQGTSTSHLAYRGESGVGAVRLRVKGVRLDDLVDEGEIRPPRLIKIDVEGHGGSALEGARTTIARHRPAIVISMHSREESVGTRKVLEPLGYRVLAIDSGAQLPWTDDLTGTLLLLP
jgi:FkbM family methyltransferase